MSDETNAEPLAEGIADLPFPVIDATLHMLFIGLPPSVSWKRKSLTSGSCVYQWQLGPKALVLTIYALPEDKAVLTVKVTGKEATTFDASWWLRSFYTWVVLKIGEARKNVPPIELGDPHPHLAELIQAAVPSRQRPRGADEDPTNREARQAITRGEDRKATFRKWARAKKYNISDLVESQKAEAAFRKMLSRKLKNQQRDVT